MATSTDDGIDSQTSFYCWWKLGSFSPRQREPHLRRLGGGVDGGTFTSAVGKVWSGIQQEW